MTSLWMTAGPPGPAVIDPADGRRVDVAVVGAGIAGLCTALLLARSSKSVLVLEAPQIGAGATGNTTGKVSLVQGPKLSRIKAKHGDQALCDSVTGNIEGRNWLGRFAEAHGVDIQLEDAYSYAQSGAGIDSARAELDACQAAGLAARWIDDADVTFPFHGGVQLRDQGQLDPLPLLAALVSEIEKHGGTVCEGTRVAAVSAGRPLRLTVESAAWPTAQTVTAEHCILATGVPILDRGRRSA